MILFELKCGQAHTFEAWFRNGETYDRQAAEGAIACPTCGDNRIVKAPMAPRISKNTAKAQEAQALQAELLKQLRELRQQVETNADYVGEKFAEEARRIHYGEAESRAIYGEATREETAELEDEGIPVARIPWVPNPDS